MQSWHLFKIWACRGLAAAVWVCASHGAAWAAFSPSAKTPAAPSATLQLQNKDCLSCHEKSAKKGSNSHEAAPVSADKFDKSVHAQMECVACHTGINDSPSAGKTHARSTATPERVASCPDCHQKLWEDAQKNNTAASKPRLGVVAANIEAYKNSFHAKIKKGDTQPLAFCEDCHSSHTFNVPPKESPQRSTWKLSTAEVCGEKCHSDQLDEYKESVHGKAVYDKQDAKAATCIDCHTSHSVGNTSAVPIKLAITANCGNCHTDEYKSYKATYHGQVSTLGYGNTAKCFDCHGSHGIAAVKDPASKVHADNRLETCQSCHNGKKAGTAAAGFVSFQPHARTNDFHRYPQVFLGFQLMVGLLLGTFGFFWLHTALWFYRELKDRREGKTTPHIKLDALPSEYKGKHFRRFSPTWRVAHILFALSLMALTFTGMPLFYPDAAWAPWVMKALGGPVVAGNIHRVCAIVFAGVFFWHLVYIAIKIWRQRKTFRVFGPESLVPGIQDLKDIIAMFKWFFGKAPRPVFDHWTYWEKFDYWAPFWGVTIIGVSGLMMWLPNLTATYLPGWVFNVAAIFHGEEAFLAVVFLFTVHFFNNHFRPDKFPVEIVMFTGTMSLDHYRAEHALEFERLKASGQLDQYVVDAPSAPVTWASKVLGFILIAVGLTLLFGVAVGFFSSLH